MIIICNYNENYLFATSRLFGAKFRFVGSALSTETNENMPKIYEWFLTLFFFKTNLLILAVNI